MRISRTVVMAATAITVAVVATGLALALIESNAGVGTLAPARAVAAGHPGATGKADQSGPARHGAGRSRGDRTGRHKPGHSGRSRPTPAPVTPAPHSTSKAKRSVGGRLLASSGIIVHDPSGSPPLPNVPASAYVIATAGDGQVLAAKDPHGLYPPASTLKVLTAITMLPRLHPDSMVLATKKAASVEPNIIGVIPGHRYRAADLFRALLMISANDAAVSLAQASGSLAKGLRLMNAEAHHLQAYDVVARQPNGLPANGQVVSAYDLALIARRALHMASFMRYDQTLTASFPVTSRHSVAMVNQNSLLTQYRGGIGGKIGWTVAAGATYVGMARRNGVTLIVTILHATPLTEIASAEKLLNWGFAMDGQAHPVGVLVRPLPVPGSSPHRAGQTSLTTDHHTADHLATNHHATSHLATSHLATSHHATNHHATNHHTTSHLATSHHAINHHATSHHATNHHATNHHTTSHLTAGHHAINHHATSHLTAGHLAATAAQAGQSADARALARAHADTSHTHAAHADANHTRAAHAPSVARTRTNTNASTRTRTRTNGHSGLLVARADTVGYAGTAGATFGADQYSYALTGQAWLRRARLAAGASRDHGGLPEPYDGKSP